MATLTDEEIYRIIKRHRPRGWRIYFSLGRTKKALTAKDKDERGVRRAGLIDCAEANFERRIIRSPHVGCEYTLQILLHEFGHVHLKHISYVGDPPDKGIPMHRQEFEADRWSMEIMRLEGVTVTRAIKLSAKRYLRHCIKKDEAQGVDIQPHVRKRT
jgi:hypothetical protein